MILEIFSGERISVGTPFYTITVVPIIFLFSVLAPMAIFLPWGKLNVDFKYIKIFLLLTGSSLFTWIFYIYFDVQNIFSNLGVFVSFWIILGSLYVLIIKNKKPNFPSFFGHLGLGILILGCSISISSQKQYEGPLSFNENIVIGDFKIKFLDVQDGTGPNYINSTGSFSLEKSGRFINLTAEKRFYPVEKSITTEAGIYSKYFSHIYIILGEKINSEEWMVRIWFKPLVSLIWIGALITAFGGILSLFKKINLRMNFKYLFFLIIFLFSFPINSYSNVIDNDKVEQIENRIKSINQNIRCLVCESQTIDESNSPLAKDLRSIVRSKVLNNETDESIYNYFRERYGDYIIMKPSFKNSTLFLWIAPFIFLIFGFVLILKYQRKQNGS
jgi:cytochrome c-type biogenesis protein CcmF